MPVMLAFDVYGTLINTHGVVTALREVVDDKAEKFSQTWRDKQLEYSFRRGLMQQYETFAVCTRQALDYTCDHYRTPMTRMQKDELLGVYRILPAFEDTADALEELSPEHFKAYAFSNGTAEAVETLLENADLRQYFAGVVSVDEVESFKPNPLVYTHLLSETGSPVEHAWLISSNPFDVIGAIAIGMKAAWVQRSPTAVFDPWGLEPTLTVASLRGLGKQIADYEAANNAA